LSITNNNVITGCDGADDKIVIFDAEEFLRRFYSGYTIFMDGTFKSAPKLFTQFYTLHCFVVAVMDTSSNYNFIFTFIKNYLSYIIYTT